MKLHATRKLRKGLISLISFHLVIDIGSLATGLEMKNDVSQLLRSSRNVNFFILQRSENCLLLQRVHCHVGGNYLRAGITMYGVPTM